jgi:hypothetical protein
MRKGLSGQTSFQTTKEEDEMDRFTTMNWAMGKSVPLGVAVVLALCGSSCLDEDPPDVESASDALETECTEGAVTWNPPGSASQRCTGPWTYEEYRVVESRDPLCPRETCIRHAECWVRQPDAHPTMTTAFINGVQPCRWEDTDPPTRVCEPNWSEAQSQCNAWLPTGRAPYETSTRRVNSSSVTPTLATSSAAQSHQFLCTATLQWDERKVDASCPCAEWRYQLCRHADQHPPLVEVITPANKTKTEVKSAHDARRPFIPGQKTGAEIAPICTTGEDEADLVKKLNRLLTNMTRTRVVQPGTELFNDFVKRAKLTYEFFKDADVTSFQRRPEAVRLYEQYPTIEPSCGLSKPSTEETCDGDWQLRLCTRLTSAHVRVEPGLPGQAAQGDLVRELYPQCLDQLQKLGDGIEGEMCSAEGDYMDVTVDTQRRLHEKLLLRFGRGFQANDPARQALADILSLLNQWYARAARMSSGSPLASELALFTNKFWQIAHGYRVGQVGEGQPEWLPGNLYAELLEELDDGGDLAAALQTTERGAFALDRAVLAASYGFTGDQPTLAGAPLLQITTDALKPLAERLDELVQYHDVGCSLAECAAFMQPTKLSRFWKVLAQLTARSSTEPEPDLGRLLSALTDADLPSWRPTFQLIQAAQQRLLDALAAAPEADAYNELPALVARAQARTASYEGTGLFLPATGDRLQTGVHRTQRDLVKNHVISLANRIEGRRADVERRLVSLVDGLVRVREAETAAAQLQATMNILNTELADLRRRDAALRRLMNGAEDPPREPLSEDTTPEEDVFEMLMKEWREVEDGLDLGARLRIGSTTTEFLSGQNAEFTGWGEATTIESIGARKIHVAGKETLSVTTEGQWSPSCAVRKARLVQSSHALDPDATIEPVRLGDPLIGPEGYGLAQTSSGFEARTAHAGVEDRLTFGWKSESCAGLMANGTGTHYCGYVDVSTTLSAGAGWQAGSESRLSAQFTSGLFLPSTPFEAPAGALVVVEMPEGGQTRGEMRALHMVRGPHTTIVVNGPADLWLVVNDHFCEDRSSDALTVTVQKFVGQGDSAVALLERIAYAAAKIRDRRAELVELGEILPSVSTEIERQAKHDVIAGGLNLSVDQYEPPMQNLFYKYLAREMMRLEAAVRLTHIEREIRIKEEEFRAAETALHNSRMSGYLLALLPKWSVRGMEFRELRADAAVYADDIRYFLGPILKIWYPDVIREIDRGSIPAVLALTAVDVNTSMLDAANLLRALGIALEGAIEQAQVLYPLPEETAPTFVTLRFPKPTELDLTCAENPSARCRRRNQASTFRWATVAQTRALWDALGRAGDGVAVRRLVFEPTPADIYELVIGTHYLPCTKSLPVVRKLGLAFTGYASGEEPDTSLSVEGHIPPTAGMGFPDATGMRVFEMANQAWRNLAAVPILFAGNDYNVVRTALGRFDELSQDVRGVSPFTSLVFDIPEDQVIEFQMREARSIDLVMELEAIRSSQPVAVPNCTATAE